MLELSFMLYKLFSLSDLHKMMHIKINIININISINIITKYMIHIDTVNNCKVKSMTKCISI